jgi:hypothetical protein
MQVCPVKNKSKPQGAAPQTPLKDSLGQWVWRLRKPRIIKRSIAYPTNSNQGFYYNLLLDHVAFRGDRELLPDGSDYFTECIRLGVFKSTAELDQHLQAYARYNLYQQFTLDKLRARVATTCGDLAVNALGSPNQAAAEDDTPSEGQQLDDGLAAALQGADALQQQLHKHGAGYLGQEPTEVAEGAATATLQLGTFGSMPLTCLAA